MNEFSLEGKEEGKVVSNHCAILFFFFFFDNHCAILLFCFDNHCAIPCAILNRSLIFLSEQLIIFSYISSSSYLKQTKLQSSLILVSIFESGTLCRLSPKKVLSKFPFSFRTDTVTVSKTLDCIYWVRDIVDVFNTDNNAVQGRNYEYNTDTKSP